MTVVLIYDVSGDRQRAKIADACLDYGLQRIQYSAFFGEISPNHLEELLMRIKVLARGTEVRVEVFPIGARELALRRTLATKRFREERAKKEQIPVVVVPVKSD